MGAELVVMSTRELDRLGVIRQVLERRTTRARAAELLGLGAKQVTRLCQAFERDGAAGLVSRKRGRAGNRKIATEVENQAIELVRSHYEDFGPTLVREKLLERHGLKLGKETVRRMLRRAGIWVPRDQRIPKPHQPRFRRSCLGELVQIDGSEHAWFEDRGASCSLLVYVDDATGRLMELHFAVSESADSYFAATASYLRHHGKPVTFYSDKHSIFRVAREGAGGVGRGVTQFGRALGELNIDIICANSPQAKGRVERMNKTLQDRLVKELRLQRISTMAAANSFVDSFIADYNAKFAKPPRDAFDAHRPLGPTDDLDRVFCHRVLRTMTANLVVNFGRRTYLVTPTDETRRLAGRRRQVVIHTWPDGRMEIQHDGKPLPFKAADNYPFITPGDVVEQKRIGEVMEQIRLVQAAGGPARTWAPQRAPALGFRKPPLRAPIKAPSSVVELAPRVASGDDPAPEAVAPYVLRWVRKQPFLYARTFVAHTVGGHPVVKDERLGSVDPEVARLWQERGDFSLPPPLEGATLPPATKAFQRSRTATQAPRLAGQPPAPPADPRARLNAALWFTDAFHARESARIREINEAADAEALANQPAARKPARRAAIRPMVGSTLGRRGSGVR
jgi:transposase